MCGCVPLHRGDQDIPAFLLADLLHLFLMPEDDRTALAGKFLLEQRQQAAGRFLLAQPGDLEESLPLLFFKPPYFQLPAVQSRELLGQTLLGGLADFLLLAEVFRLGFE